MSLKITIPQGSIPNRLEGTIDGITPAIFEVQRKLWRIAFGEWSFCRPAGETVSEMTAFIYEGVASYRTAHRR